MVGGCVHNNRLYACRKMKTILITIMLALATAMPKQVTADFILVKSSPMLQGEHIFLGKLTYRSPDYIRWEYTSPERAVLELNGTKGNLSPQVKRMVEMIAACVNGKADERNLKVDEKGNVMTITPQRREMKRVVEKIVVIIDPKTGFAASVEIHEANGGKTSIAFSNVKVVK